MHRSHLSGRRTAARRSAVAHQHTCVHSAVPAPPFLAFRGMHGDSQGLRFTRGQVGSHRARRHPRDGGGPGASSNIWLVGWAAPAAAGCSALSDDKGGRTARIGGRPWEQPQGRIGHQEGDSKSGFPHSTIKRDQYMRTRWGGRVKREVSRRWQGTARFIFAVALRAKELRRSLGAPLGVPHRATYPRDKTVQGWSRGTNACAGGTLLCGRVAFLDLAIPSSCTHSGHRRAGGCEWRAASDRGSTAPRATVAAAGRPASA